MSKNTKILLLEYLVVFICLIFLLYTSNSAMENKDLFEFLGTLICLASIFLCFLISINHSLRKIANSQTKDKNHDS
jgi:hypothetical protein